jgi:hypothetical protein
MKSKGRDIAATAEKVSAKHKTLSGFDFVITVAAPTWQRLDDSIRLAVMDHELEHCWIEETDSGELKYKILPHDVEEFGSIIMRHGLYTVNLVKLGKVVENALVPDDISKKKKVVKKIGKPEEEVEADSDFDDDLANLDRKALKKYIKEEEIDVSVKKSMSDDDIRKAITEWREELEVADGNDTASDHAEEDEMFA